MWEAIAYVSSGLTLTAFLAAVIAWVLKVKIEQRERLIRTSKSEQRADLVRNALEFFHVDTSALTKDQQYNVAIEQIRARAQRFTITAIAICFLAVVASVIAANAITIINKKQQPLRVENGVSIAPTAVNRYEAETSYFEKRGESWIEQQKGATSPLAQFREVHVDAQYIYLVDPSRIKEGEKDNPLNVRIPIKGGMVQWSWENPVQWTDLRVVSRK